MSVSTRNPLRMAGAVFSGNPATGEVSYTRGGQQNGTVWSGDLAPALRGLPAGSATSGNQIRVWSGAGRLHTIMPHTYMTSGQAVLFYDAALPARSGAGPVASLIAESGARVIGIIPLVNRGVLSVISGQTQTAVNWDNVINVDMPFNSGLNIACPSGSPGFSFAFTPEIQPNAVQ